MSQIGVVISVAQYGGAGVGGSWSNGTFSDGASWIIQYAFQLDSGGTAQAQVVVGSGAHSTVALWASPTSTIQVAAPGSSASVVLPCPPLIATAAYGAPLK
jgi:hypothetical protein